ncbi:methyltransferase domain-containing protein [Nocardiopsis sp. HNM0947]|uniref:Methyltransferase domain-containing protein n=2 Tax=Nocardiopsis coralli TaxID=2772213 RepID=A0ABR9P0L6_9ACTN|nr:methyltransferase domain-containing protein [Nocardiopsis coralli]
MLANHLDPDVDAASNRAAYIEEAVAWMAARFGAGPGRSVLDLGCGPGLYTNRLAAAGAEVVGVDLAPRSIEHARGHAHEQGLSTRHLCADYLELDLGERFDLVVMVMRDYCALAPADRARLLRVVRAHLADGGAFCFDVDSAAAFDTVTEQRTFAPDLMGGFWSPDPYYGFWSTLRYEAERVSLDRYDIVDPGGRRTFYNWITYFTPEELARELAGSGLVLDEVLGDLTGHPPQEHDPSFAVVARPA